MTNFSGANNLRGDRAGGTTTPPCRFAATEIQRDIDFGDFTILLWELWVDLIIYIFTYTIFSIIFPFYRRHTNVTYRILIFHLHRPPFLPKPLKKAFNLFNKYQIYLKYTEMDHDKNQKNHPVDKIYRYNYPHSDFLHRIFKIIIEKYF